MDAPTISELQDFTLDCYIKLLKYLRQQYRIIPFCEVRYEDTPYLILRHDVDISLEAALTMAEIEKNLGIQSTYFVLLSSVYYNLFEGENMKILKRISELGHEIGIHYYPAQFKLYGQSPEKTLQIETQILESFLGKKVRSISRHGLWDMDPFVATRKYINANHPYLRADLFVHDSNRAWVTIDDLSALLSSAPKRAQLLIHPDNWQEDRISRERLLEKRVKPAESKIQRIKQSLLDHYQNEPLVVAYDHEIGKAEFNQQRTKSAADFQPNYKTRSFFNYYFVNSRIGWSINRLESTFKRKFNLRIHPASPLAKVKSTKEKENSNENPLVSIIITSYNYGHYLSDAIKSALGQTYSNVEIVVVDDGSTDSTKNVIALHPVKYVYQNHQGVSAARNSGISQTNGEFFICLDGDDKIVPEYVETTLEQMTKNPRTGFVYTGSRIWNEITELENIRMPRRILSKYSLFSGWMGAQGPMLVRRAAFASLDHGYDPRFPAHEDLDICFRLLKKGWKSDLVYGPLHWYRVHSGSLNPGTPQRKRIAGAFMDREFWFRAPYRRLYSLYLGTLGRVELLIRNPGGYLRGIRKKIQVNTRIKTHINITPEDRDEALQLQNEIQFTVDALVKWQRHKSYRKYYEHRIRILEARLANLTQQF